MVPHVLLPLAVAAAFALACLPALATLTTRRAMQAAAVVWLVAASGLAFAAVRLYPPLPRESENTDRPVEVHDRGYVSSATCQACHPDEYASWHSSYHRTMTQVARPEIVAGDFDDVKLAFHRANYRLERRGDEFWVGMDDPAWDGPPERAPWIERRIVLTTGSHHDQDYWYAMPGPGRDLRLLPLNYRVQEKKWVPFSAAFLLPPHLEFDYSPSKWTQTCVKCHATYGRQSLDPTTEQVDSRVAEFGIACEACHGPAARHVAANQNPLRRYQLHLRGASDPTIVLPPALPSARASEVCGQCHGQWSERRSGTDLADSPERYRPGGVLERQRMYQQFASADPSRAQVDPQKHAFMKYLLEQEQDYLLRSFWSDGMVRISGREYTGMIESPCMRSGEYQCFSCHSMHQRADDPRPVREWADHQMRADKTGNGACLGCHAQFKSAQALSDHTHHAPESTGSTCYNCHMPYTVYGILKAHRAHQVSSPSVASTLATGRPNACNACHLDRTLAWTADRLASFYGMPRPELDHDQQTIAASVLWALRGDAGQRVLTAWYMGWSDAIATSGSDWMIPYLGELMGDPYDAVRFVAGRSLGRHEGYRDVAYDYVAEPAKIDATRADVARRWERAGRPAVRAAGVLQREDGALDLDAYHRLRALRDERPVELDE